MSFGFKGLTKSLLCLRILFAILLVFILLDFYDSISFHCFHILFLPLIGYLVVVKHGNQLIELSDVVKTT
jgi:hypothetical protein